MAGLLISKLASLPEASHKSTKSIISKPLPQSPSSHLSESYLRLRQPWTLKSTKWTLSRHSSQTNWTRRSTWSNLKDLLMETTWSASSERVYTVSSNRRGFGIKNWIDISEKSDSNKLMQIIASMSTRAPTSLSLCGSMT